MRFGCDRLGYEDMAMVVFMYYSLLRAVTGHW